MEKALNNLRKDEYMDKYEAVLFKNVKLEKQENIKILLHVLKKCLNRTKNVLFRMKIS